MLVALHLRADPSGVRGRRVLELVIDGETGFVVPVQDARELARAIQYLCEHPAEAAAMGRKARERIDERFNIRQTIERTLAIYRDALADQ